MFAVTVYFIWYFFNS